MGKFCEICSKGTQYGKKLSHSRSHVSGRANKRWAPNVQKMKVIINGSARTMNVCTRCLRSGKVQRSI